jgi:hypothetical protein
VSTLFYINDRLLTAASTKEFNEFHNNSQAWVDNIVPDFIRGPPATKQAEYEVFLNVLLLVHASFL